MMKVKQLERCANSSKICKELDRFHSLERYLRRCENLLYNKGRRKMWGLVWDFESDPHRFKFQLSHLFAGCVTSYIPPHVLNPIFLIIIRNNEI